MPARTPKKAAAARERDDLQSLSNASAAVLGMVALGAQSGYEVQRAADLSLRFFWALGPPQIYSELSRLDEAGLVVGADQARGRRARRVYEITDAGQAALRRWVTGPDGASLEIRDPALLRLFFADAVADADAVQHLTAIRRRSERALTAFDEQILPAARRTADLGFEYPELVARFGVELHEFITGWCDRTVQEFTDAE